MTRQRDRTSADSIRARLLNHARERGEEFQRVLVQFANERFLYRLFNSVHAEEFVLKGATLFGIWTDTPHRSTKDVDLLGYGPPQVDRVAAVLRDLLVSEVEPDGLRYEANSLKVRPIREGHAYDGLRATFLAFLGSARISLQVDIAFGDATAIPPVDVVLPSLLDNVPTARVRAYAREVVVAEKFHIMVELGLLNTRLKDYFDLFVLCRRFAFEGEELARAIDATFERRQTMLPVTTPEGLTEEFGKDTTKAAQWAAFLRRSGAKEKVALEQVVDMLRSFLMPPCAARASSKPFSDRWPEGGPWHPSH